jgi:ribosomal protein L32E
VRPAPSTHPSLLAFPSRPPQPSWRKPRGIDNRARRRFKGNLTLVSIGWGTNAKTRHILPSGFRKVVVNNVKDLETLLMHNRKCVAGRGGSSIVVGER